MPLPSARISRIVERWPRKCCARAQFVEEPEVKGQASVVLMEMTLRSLSEGARVDHADFLARADLLRALGYDVRFRALAKAAPADLQPAP